jgi:hypothetical protein
LKFLQQRVHICAGIGRSGSGLITLALQLGSDRIGKPGAGVSRIVHLLLPAADESEGPSREEKD